LQPAQDRPHVGVDRFSIPALAFGDRLFEVPVVDAGRCVGYEVGPLLAAEQHAVAVVGVRAGDDTGLVTVSEHSVDEMAGVVEGACPDSQHVTVVRDDGAVEAGGGEKPHDILLIASSGRASPTLES
jgi:hypothetical protein